MAKRSFRRPHARNFYRGVRHVMADLTCSAYAQPVSGVGPPAPLRLGRIAQAYWLGRQGVRTPLARYTHNLDYVGWAAGHDDRLDDLKLRERIR